MEYSKYATMTERELVRAWATNWVKHEDSYLQNDTQGCIDADKEMSKVEDILYCKFEWTGEMLRDLYHYSREGLIKVN